jgi:RND superfamily putative drug exporter
MTETSTKHAAPEAKRPLFAHAIRLLAVPIILGWVAITVVVNTIAPSLAVVGEAHSSPMAPEDAPSMIAMRRMGHNLTRGKCVTARHTQLDTPALRH